MTTYRIEARDNGKWAPAPGEATGWTLDEAQRAVAAGLVWLDGTPVDPVDVRIVAESPLVRCDSPDGWSLHAPGSTDEDIASGDAPYLVSGTGQPTLADYQRARALLAERF